MPDPVPVEFIDMANEVGGGLPIQENGGTVVAFEFDITKWSGDLAAFRL